jgi:hypothetical protein
LLRDIVKTLGTMLAIEVAARIPRATTVTRNFARLSLHDTHQRLRTFATIVSLTEFTQPASKITKMTVLPSQGVHPHSGAVGWNACPAWRGMRVAGVPGQAAAPEAPRRSAGGALE